MLRGKKVGLIGDIHLGLKQNSEQWHNIAMKCGKWIVEDLKSKGIEDVICMGDLFHERDEIAVNTIDFASKFLTLFDDFNVIIVVGNHDAFYKESVEINSLSILKGWKNITIMDETTTIETQGRKLSFVPWAGELSKLEKSDALFGHLEIESFKMNTFKVCDSGMKIKDLLNISDLIVTGHFHLREERKLKKGTILYVGNPYQMDFGDAGNTKGYYTLDLEDMSYDFVQNEVSPEHIKISLSRLIQYDGITEEVESMFKGNIIRLVIDKAIASDDSDRLLYKLSNLEPFQLSVDYDVNFSKFELLDGDDFDMSGFDYIQAIEEFINMLDIGNKKETAEYIVELYNKYKFKFEQ